MGGLLLTGFIAGLAFGAFAAAFVTLFLSPLIGRRPRMVAVSAGSIAPIIAAAMTVNAIVTPGDGTPPSDIKPIVVWSLLALTPGALIGSVGAALLTVRLITKALGEPPTPPP